MQTFLSLFGYACLIAQFSQKTSSLDYLLKRPVSIFSLPIYLMFEKLIFNCLSESFQIKSLRKKGTKLKTYYKNGRKVHLYSMNDFYVEVIFINDNTDLLPEKITTYHNVEDSSSNN